MTNFIRYYAVCKKGGLLRENTLNDIKLSYYDYLLRCEMDARNNKYLLCFIDKDDSPIAGKIGKYEIPQILVESYNYEYRFSISVLDSEKKDLFKYKKIQEKLQYSNLNPFEEFISGFIKELNELNEESSLINFLKLKKLEKENKQLKINIINLENEIKKK